MRRYVLMMAVVIAVIAAACSGSGSENASDSVPRESSDAIAADEPAGDTSIGDDLADVQADALVTDGGISPEDAAFVAQFPIPTLAGGDVLVAFGDGTMSQLRVAHPLWKKDAILRHYDIWAQSTIVESQLDDSEDNEGLWQGLNADGVLIRIEVFEPADMEDTVIVDLVWQP